MSRINTNVQSLIAQRVLGNNNAGLGQSLERLSTGLRINRGKDDPAGLIASENLRAEKASLNSAISNAERADQVANIAEGGLQEISSLLTEIQGLVTQTANDAGLSQAEKEANQLQVDSILQTIDRIADATSFQGNKLLNGNFDYTSTNLSAGVSDFRVNGAKVGFGQSLQVQALVTTSAQQAGFYLSTGATLNLNGGTNSAFTIEVTGTLGSRQLSFASGTTVANIAAAVNTFTDVTGVVASTSGGATGVKLTSSDYGSEAFVNIRVLNDANIQNASGIYDLSSQNFNSADASSATTFSSTNASNGVRDLGQDLSATINGVAATAKGKVARINTDFLNVEINFNDGSTSGPNSAQTAGVVNAFTITGGGADFQLASRVDIAGKVSVGVQDVSARKLGNSETGFLSQLSSGDDFNIVDGDLTSAQKVVAEAIDQISTLRGRLGAFQKNTVGATIRNLGVTFENTAAAESVIRDADFASETAALTRGQILVNASTNTLSLANQQPQSALQLLG